MKVKKIVNLVVSAMVGMGLGSAMVMTSSVQAKNESKGDQKPIKCYGVAKKAKNDCGTAKHACAGQAAESNDPQEWVFATPGKCEQLKTSEAAAQHHSAAQHKKAPKTVEHAKSKELAKESDQQPAQESAKEPAKELVKKPAQESVQEPVQATPEKQAD